MNCRYQSEYRTPKVKANAAKPRIVSSSSPEVRGTSRATISSVTAKPKTASLNPSRREISRLRQRNSCLALALCRSMSFSRSMRPSTPAQDADRFQILQVFGHLGERQRPVDGGEGVPDLADRAPAVHQVQSLIGVLGSPAPEARTLEQSRRGDLLRGDV